ncbi:MAG: acyl transferase [Bacteroidia bacterium]|jgi:phenylacetate-coenzyme A ligase PaaK-like adenylate-forming protein|nr:acyl transferase [Bacteroidia bacterium]
MNAALLRQQIFTADDYEQLTLEVFRHQARHVAVYREFVQLLGINPQAVTHTSQIPYLPAGLFKTHRILEDGLEPQQIFTSSGTTGQVTSQHLVADVSLYEESFMRGFELFYGDVRNYVVLALLPSYLEREGSSLVYMADVLIKRSGRTESGFYLHNLAELSALLRRLDAAGQPVLLLGVTYALLDLAEQFAQPLRHVIIMETGGMKGKRREMIREEVHGILQQAFGVPHIHSEYGMTELLSQAYSKGEGIFSCPPWMRIHIREMNDPLSVAPPGKTGGVCITDLANLHSCSFIATQDLGKLHSNGHFEILGRFDHSDVRGCNLMVD